MVINLVGYWLYEFENKEFLSIETFRKTGVGVKAPIWFAELDGEFLLWTDVNSGKIERIRNNLQVMIAPCTRFGDITGEWVSARASADETPKVVGQVEALLRGKVGYRVRLLSADRQGAGPAQARPQGLRQGFVP